MKKKILLLLLIAWISISSVNFLWSNKPLQTESTAKGSSQVVIRKIFENGSAQKVGLRENDILLTIEGEMVTTPQLFTDILRSSQKESVKISVSRNGNLLTFTVPINKREGVNVVDMGISPSEVQSMKSFTLSNAIEKVRIVLWIMVLMVIVLIMLRPIIGYTISIPVGGFLALSLLTTLLKYGFSLSRFLTLLLWVAVIVLSIALLRERKTKLR